MDPRAQRHLARLLTKARGGPFWGSWIRWSVDTYAEFLAVLHALLETEAMTLAEAKDFQNRMLVILGREPLPVDPNANGLPYVWLGAPNPWVESERPTLRKVTESESPEVVTPWGGHFRVRRVEFYDDRTVVHWNLDRWEDIGNRIARAIEDNAHDTEGLAQSVRDDLRNEVQPYIGRSMNHFRLVDDIDTPYIPKGGSTGGTEGQSTYLPAVPASASRLCIEWYEWSIEISRT